MRGCNRPLKLTEFVSSSRFRGIVVSACNLEASCFSELLVVLKHVRAAVQQSKPSHHFVEPNGAIYLYYASSS